ncbi:transmembrane protein 237-like [Babylonia areolata]|uniref:transmembrane protein 237-like n=1 Tax=Babylonia areolata TaxID=304850 RepID=UPI003FCEEC84
MADEGNSPPKKLVTKKKDLPPISPRNGENPQPARRKKKKPSETAYNGQISAEADRPAPRRQPRSTTPAGKKASNADGSGGEGSGATTTTPKKLKRKPKAKAEAGDQAEEAPVSDRSATSAQEDMGGSKTSLIKEGGTPRKKGKKKGPKKSSEGQGDRDDLGDSYLASDLQDIKEDVVGMDTNGEEGEEKSTIPFKTSAPILHSQPIDKIFIETNRGFKGYTKAQLTRRAQQEKEEKASEPEQPTKTTLEFGLSTHSVFKTVCLFLHGLTAGLALWQIVVVYILSRHSDQDFLQHYQVLALPVQCVFYLLLALCVISACDRFDVGNPTGRFVMRALTLQNGAVSIVVYLVGLVLSLSTMEVEDRIHLLDKNPMLWNSTQVTDDELTTFRSLNTARGVAAILGWFIIALAPNTDRLSKNLKEGDDDILSGQMELDQVSPA